MWVFPMDFNVLDNGYSSLETLFMVAPWVFLFLVPAVTMRSFAEENRAGTIELLLTKPLTEFQIVFAKFLSGFALVVLSPAAPAPPAPRAPWSPPTSCAPWASPTPPPTAPSASPCRWTTPKPRSTVSSPPYRRSSPSCASCPPTGAKTARPPTRRRRLRRPTPDGGFYGKRDGRIGRSGRFV